MAEACGAWARGTHLKQPKPPEKGVFPLDHFAECKQVRRTGGGAGMRGREGAWATNKTARMHCRLALDLERQGHALGVRL